MSTTAQATEFRSRALRQRFGLAEVVGLISAATILLSIIRDQTVLDLDVFHQMALVRAAIQLRAFPMHDVFAYTSTATYSVHYEWGNGAILYVVTRVLGAPGLLLLKYLLTLTITALAVRVALRRNTSWPVIFTLAPSAALMVAPGLTTIRAGLFTLVFLGALMNFIQDDREGKRIWVVPWLLIYVLWLNIHPGFLVGGGILGLHWLEQLIRYRKPQWHLVATGLAMMILLLANPYGRLYPVALYRAWTMQLPPLAEWNPMWKARSWACAAVYFASLVVALYAFLRAGWRKTDGIFILIVCAAAAMQHLRHIYLYALVWFCYVPGWLTLSPLGIAITNVWNRRRRLMSLACCAIIPLLLPGIIRAKPWHLHIPVTLNDPFSMGDDVTYPVGAVEYLRHAHFHGNIMTHYNDGSYVMWQLWPDVRIGLDSRNDVGYSYPFICEILAFYKGQPGWHESLARYPTDIVLVKRSYPLAELMASQTNWSRVYRDDAFELWAPRG